MPSKSLRESKSFAKDKTFSFMNLIEGNPTYWKKVLHQILAIIK